MDGKTAFANILAREGVDVVFCFPNNILIDACAAAGIRPIISRMERTAVNMADAYSRVNNGNKNGVVLVQGGPGIENAFSGVAQAYADSSPLLMVPNHPGTRRHGMSSDFDAARNYQGVTKWADSANHTERIPELMRRAYTQLRTGRPYPVLVEMPNDVLAGENLRGAVPLPAATKASLCGRPARCFPRRRTAGERPPARHLRRPGRALRRGHPGTGGTGRVAQRAHDDHHAGQKRIPGKPPPGPGRRRQHGHENGRRIPGEKRPGFRHRHQLPENPGVGSGSTRQDRHPVHHRRERPQRGVSAGRDHRRRRQAGPRPTG